MINKITKEYPLKIVKRKIRNNDGSISEKERYLPKVNKPLKGIVKHKKIDKKNNTITIEITKTEKVDVNQLYKDMKKVKKKLNIK